MKQQESPQLQNKDDEHKLIQTMDGTREAKLHTLAYGRPYYNQRVYPCCGGRRQRCTKCTLCEEINHSPTTEHFDRNGPHQWYIYNCTKKNTKDTGISYP